MEAVHQSNRNLKRGNLLHPIAGRFDNFAPSSFHGGLLHAPPPSLYYSLPPSISLLNPRQRQPPLLPLPIPNHSDKTLCRGLSCPPINRKINNRRTPKKFKQPISPKRADSKQDLKSTAAAAAAVSSECSIRGSSNPLGPDPKPKDVSRVLSSPFTVNYSDLLFAPSPPPSSLPLPSFSLRPKLSCNAEASRIDSGASTDSLR